jgi:hypothetical protein
MATYDHFHQLGILTDAPEMLPQLVSSHGMLAILEVLEGNCSREVNMKLLHIVNLVSSPPDSHLRYFLTLLLLACYRRRWISRKFLLDWVCLDFDPLLVMAC